MQKNILPIIMSVIILLYTKPFYCSKSEYDVIKQQFVTTMQQEYPKIEKFKYATTQFKNAMRDYTRAINKLEQEISLLKDHENDELISKKIEKHIQLQTAFQKQKIFFEGLYNNNKTKLKNIICDLQAGLNRWFSAYDLIMTTQIKKSILIDTLKPYYTEEDITDFYAIDLEKVHDHDYPPRKNNTKGYEIFVKIKQIEKIVFYITIMKQFEDQIGTRIPIYYHSFLNIPITQIIRFIHIFPREYDALDRELEAIVHNVF